MKLLPIFIFLTIVRVGYTQVLEEKPDSTRTDQNFSLTSYSYPISLFEEEHGSFEAIYRITDNTHVALQGFYDTYLISNRFRTNIALKHYLTKKLYVFGGMEVEFANFKGISEPLPPRISTVMGFGYDVSSGLSIEGKYNTQLNSSTIGAYGEPLIPMPQVYTIGGKFKF